MIGIFISYRSVAICKHVIWSTLASRLIAVSFSNEVDLKPDAVQESAVRGSYLNLIAVDLTTDCVYGSQDFKTLFQIEVDNTQLRHSMDLRYVGYVKGVPQIDI
jgi:hypothetical protein